MLKIATWNVNSVKARRERLLAWLARETPDVVCLQELKVEREAFPSAEIEALGYRAALHCQKSYNGVAILSRRELADVRADFRDGADDGQARLIDARLPELRVICAYAPNGGEVGSDKWLYKLAWFSRLRTYLERDCDRAQPLLLCGDLNIAPDDLDVARPDEWRSTVLCAAEVRAEFVRLIDWGFTDVMRKHHPSGGPYTWWDYRMLGFQKGNGLRIDHLLATAPLAAACTDARVDRDERKGKLPSDHAPALARFAIG